MDDLPVLALAWAAGMALGVFFFGGLWWTVRRGVAARRPALWFFGSLMMRMGIVLAGFYLVSGGRWERLLSCLLGFVVARWSMTRRFRPQNGKPAHSTQEDGHAPESR